MSLQDLKLPASVLAELYANHLVEPGPGTISTTTKGDKKDNSNKIPFLGGNAQRISIFVAEESQAFMTDDDLVWLQKMLQACKLTLGDVAIINTQTQPTTITQVKNELAPRKVLMLGPAPTILQLPLNFPPFKLQEHDNCTYLYAPSAAELNQDSKEGKLLKSKLWVSLQQLFEV